MTWDLPSSLGLTNVLAAAWGTLWVHRAVSGLAPCPQHTAFRHHAACGTSWLSSCLCHTNQRGHPTTCTNHNTCFGVFWVWGCFTLKPLITDSSWLRFFWVLSRKQHAQLAFQKTKIRGRFQLNWKKPQTFWGFNNYWKLRLANNFRLANQSLRFRKCQNILSISTIILIMKPQ